MESNIIFIYSAATTTANNNNEMIILICSLTPHRSHCHHSIWLTRSIVNRNETRKRNWRCSLLRSVINLPLFFSCTYYPPVQLMCMFFFYYTEETAKTKEDNAIFVRRKKTSSNKALLFSPLIRTFFRHCFHSFSHVSFLFFFSSVLFIVVGLRRS